ALGNHPRARPDQLADLAIGGAVPRLAGPDLGTVRRQCREPAPRSRFVPVGVARAMTAVAGFHRVVVEPAGHILDVPHGETLMQAAERAGYRWPTLCHGDGS